MIKSLNRLSQKGGFTGSRQKKRREKAEKKRRNKLTQEKRNDEDRQKEDTQKKRLAKEKKDAADTVHYNEYANKEARKWFIKHCAESWNPACFQEWWSPTKLEDNSNELKPPVVQSPFIGSNIISSKKSRKRMSRNDARDIIQGKTFDENGTLLKKALQEHPQINPEVYNSEKLQWVHEQEPSSISSPASSQACITVALSGTITSLLFTMTFFIQLPYFFYLTIYALCLFDNV